VDRAEALGILGYYRGQTPSLDQLKARYRILAKENHPDTGGEVKRFEQIKEAFEWLKDPPLDTATRASLSRELAKWENMLACDVATTSQWYPDDPRIPLMIEPKKKRIAEIKELLKVK
jgi:hypothetical protein